MRSTLTLGSSISAHTVIFATVLYKSCAVAIHKHPRPLPPKNYVRFVAFMLRLQRSFFSRIKKFLRCSTTMKLLPLTILIEGSYPNLVSLHQPCVCCDAQIHARSDLI